MLRPYQGRPPATELPKPQHHFTPSLYDELMLYGQLVSTPRISWRFVVARALATTTPTTIILPPIPAQVRTEWRTRAGMVTESEWRTSDATPYRPLRSPLSTTWTETVESERRARWSARAVTVPDQSGWGAVPEVIFMRSAVPPTLYGVAPTATDLAYGLPGSSLLLPGQVMPQLPQPGRLTEGLSSALYNALAAAAEQMQECPTLHAAGATYGQTQQLQDLLPKLWIPFVADRDGSAASKKLVLAAFCASSSPLSLVFGVGAEAQEVESQHIGYFHEWHIDVADMISSAEPDHIASGRSVYRLRVMNVQQKATTALYSWSLWSGVRDAY